MKLLLRTFAVLCVLASCKKTPVEGSASVKSVEPTLSTTPVNSNDTVAIYSSDEDLALLVMDGPATSTTDPTTKTMVASHTQDTARSGDGHSGAESYGLADNRPPIIVVLGALDDPAMEPVAEVYAVKSIWGVEPQVLRPSSVKELEALRGRKKIVVTHSTRRDIDHYSDAPTPPADVKSGDLYVWGGNGIPALSVMEMKRLLGDGKVVMSSCHSLQQNVPGVLGTTNKEFDPTKPKDYESLCKVLRKVK